jgi:phosphatidylglycerophosphate synthase
VGRHLRVVEVPSREKAVGVRLNQHDARHWQTLQQRQGALLRFGAMQAALSTSLDAWSRKHAVLLVGATLGSLAIGHPWPVAAAALVSFAVLLVQFRAAWTAEGRIALPNVVTAVKVLVVAAMGAFCHAMPGPVLTAVMMGVLALDTLDGWLARRSDAATPFGAHFDMESDALFILAVDLELYTRDRLGPWILTTGLLRYAYVLGTALVPPRGGQVPRSRFGRNAFGVLVFGLAAAMASPTDVGTAAAAVGTALVAWSFVLAFYWSYLRAPGPATTP